MTRIVVLAKEPRSGRVKTRLCPPLTPPQAARVAEAALVTTLAAVTAAAGPRPLVALDGEPGRWLPAGFDVVPQRGYGHDERIAHALLDAGGRAVLIGMDSPQVTPAQLRAATDALSEPDVDAVLGMAEDGGWWTLGLDGCDPRPALLGVPMSRHDTGEQQLRRLEALGLRVQLMPTLRDVDRIDDARAVAALIPGSPFATAVAEVCEREASGVT